MKRRLGIGDTFAGEELVYDMGFWIFKKIAIGKFTITEKRTAPSKCSPRRLQHQARFFRSTRSTYTAHIKESADKKRFITMRFEKASSTEKKTVKKDSKRDRP